jgi:hypothetical protein
MKSLITIAEKGVCPPSGLWYGLPVNSPDNQT